MSRSSSGRASSIAEHKGVERSPDTRLTHSIRPERCVPRGLSGTQIRLSDQLVIPDVARSIGRKAGSWSRQLGAVGSRRIQAATGIGAREYSRTSPPSLSQQRTAADVTT